MGQFRASAGRCARKDSRVRSASHLIFIAINRCRKYARAAGDVNRFASTSDSAVPSLPPSPPLLMGTLPADFAANSDPGTQDSNSGVSDSTQSAVTTSSAAVPTAAAGDGAALIPPNLSLEQCQSCDGAGAIAGFAIVVNEQV